jgi:hypothetical protein
MWTPEFVFQLLIFFPFFYYRYSIWHLQITLHHSIFYVQVGKPIFWIPILCFIQIEFGKEIKYIWSLRVQNIPNH